MAITNTTKPTTTLSNTSKVSTGATWATITTTWDSEPNTWLGVSQLLTNTIRVAEVLWLYWTQTWLVETRTWNEMGAGISNTDKPS